ncbi:MAG: dockerin type I domain-containing protein [Prevotella sp.]|nr:dockerin type I domain-containing protein [Prevotella sp.]
MKKIMMFLTLLLSTLGAVAQAQNTVSIGSAEMEYLSLGKTVGLPVTMDNTDDIVAVELTVQLPKGSSINANGCQLTPARANGHQISAACIDGDNNIYKVTAFSASNKPFKGSNGQIMTIDVVTSPNWIDGRTYSVTVTKALLCKSNGDNVCTKYESGAIVVPVTPHADIAFDVTGIVTTVKKGTTGNYNLQITNNGNASTGAISLQLPEWMTLQGGLMPIAPGETATAVIAMTPTGEANTIYDGYIGVNIEKGNNQVIPYKVTVVSDEKGTIAFSVCDEYTYYDASAPKVKNATIEVKNSATGETVETLNTGEEGNASIQLNEGYYSFTVTAENHETYQNNILVYPGQTIDRIVNLSINDGINIEYKVVETEEQDGYEIVTEATLEVAVPAPQVTISAPGRVKMSDVAVGESVDIQVTLTNRGLIMARDVTLTVPKIEGFRSEALTPIKFDLRPQETSFITIRYTREEESEGCMIEWNATYTWKCGDEPKSRFCKAFTSIGTNCKPCLPGNCTIVTQVEDEDVIVTVKMQFNQLLTLTRQAFEGTLTIENGSDKSMDDIMLTLTEKMPNGDLATDKEFDISYTEFTGFSGNKDNGPWTLGSGQTGVLKVKFIPTKDAAPIAPVEYLFGGNLKFSVDGKERHADLTEQVMTVKPTPELNLDYFLQRDVISDDAITKDIIEPAEEAEFAVLIRNIGYGDAENLKMVTAQPEMVDNEESLFLQYSITSSQLNGQEKTLAFGKSVTTDFGTLPAKGHAYAQWWMTSSLMGHFIDYNVSYTQITQSSNPNLSLLNEVKIHELIRSVVVEGNANADYAFAVNEVEDEQNLPDKLYLVDGTTAPINIGTGTTQNTGENLYTLTLEAGSNGWTYAKMADPSNGEATLVEVTREDGTVVPLRNIWQTWATLIDRKRPTHENLIHIIDNCQSGSHTYNLRFEPKPEATLNIISVKLNGIETGSDISVSNTEVQSVELTFTRDIQKVAPKAISLVNQGEVVDMTNVSWNIDGKKLTVDLSRAEHKDGFFCLTVNTALITDVNGHIGLTASPISWIEQTDKPVALNIAYNYPEAATVKVLAVEYHNEKTEYDTPQTPEESYAYGTTLTLKVEPNYGYLFNRWSIDGKVLSTEDTYEYYLMAGKELKLFFDRQPFNLSVSNIVDGSIIDDETESLTTGGTVTGGGTGIYEYGEEVTLTAVPESCHEFKGWYTDATPLPSQAPALQRALQIEGYQLLSTDPTYTYVVDGEKNIYPVFHRLGDVNGDKMFTIADLVCLTNHLNGNTPDNFIAAEADANHDGEITAEDVTVIAESPLMTTSKEYDGEALSVPNVKVAPGSTTNVVVYYELDGNDYTAYQMDIAYPEGISTVNGEDGKPGYVKSDVYADGQTLSSAISAKGLDRFQCFSASSSALKTNKGILITLPIKVNSSLANGVYQATISPVEFVKTDGTAYRPKPVTFCITVHEVVNNSLEMAEGWNWISTNIPADAVPFVEGLKTDFYRLVSQTQELYNDSKLGIVGSLEAIDVTAAYKLQTTTATTLALQGIPENPTITSLSLQKGYNWIGYLPMTALPVATALSQLEAAIGDRLISQNGFAEYGDDGWEGQLATMNPGEGYIYHRTADATTFCYTEDAGGNAVETVSAAAVRQSDSMEPSWSYDVHAYPDVTTIIAQLYIREQMAELDRYTVGAFCGEECRGIASVVGDKLFITVHGAVKDNETISFRVYDETTGETLPVSETTVFEGQSLGNLKSPMPLHAETVTTGISGVATMYDVRTIHSISGKRLGGLQRGVNIVTKTDGTTRKLVVE